MSWQSDAIRDYVFPLATVRPEGNDLVTQRILGTAFLIGNRGFALTASHVFANVQDAQVVGMFVPGGGTWQTSNVVAIEHHATEDVALVRLAGHDWQSFFRLSNSVEHASCRYRLWGYPDDATFEIRNGQHVVTRPDLVFNEGYIRRRYCERLLVLRGESFFELSEIAGTGASGAPVCKITTPVWDVIGIYVGEKLNERSTSVSYAVREESFRSWAPKILGTTVLEESRIIQA